MEFDPDKTYYTNFPGVSRPGPYTPREISKAPSGKIGSILYTDVDRQTNGLIDAKVVWADDVALYLEVKPEHDILIPWGDVLWIELENTV